MALMNSANYYDILLTAEFAIFLFFLNCSLSKITVIKIDGSHKAELDLKRNVTK